MENSKGSFEQLIDNVKAFENMENLINYFNSILPENEDVVTLAELNEMMEDERSYWD